MADYQSKYSGLEIDAAIAMARKIHVGTLTIEISQATSASITSFVFNGFTPTTVIGSLRGNFSTSSPFRNEVLTIGKSGDNFYAHLCSSLNYQGTVVPISGTFYVDYIAIE